MKFKPGFLPSELFYRVLIGIAFIFVLAFPFSILLWPAKILLAAFIALVAVDLIVLFLTGIRFQVHRQVQAVLSLGSENLVRLTIANLSLVRARVEVIDELPYQFQRRDFTMHTVLNPGEKKRLEYHLRPVERGVYGFGKVHLLLRSRFRLFVRQFTFDQTAEVSVYPSVLEMKQLELRTFSEIATTSGIRTLRRIGHTYEFDQIKDYVAGDEYRSINWKATSRRAKLMTNQYTDEKSQQVYSVIDVSRAMELPFNGLTLLDYAINTSLVISNIALRKQDKAGLMHFDAKQVRMVAADRSSGQLRRLLETLYNIRPQALEPNLEMLYATIRKKITQRSLVFLYTNFESQMALERALPLLRKINKFHLLVVVFFENEEIGKLASSDPQNLEDIYTQTVARKFVTTKLQLVHLLRQYSIQSVFTKPEDLSVNTVNKYLELKSRGMI
jgi:uncharacterized protein (DUF58 family)